MSIEVLSLHFVCLGAGVYCHVVHVDREPALGDFLPKDCVHHRLEGRQGVGEAEEHDHGFEQAFVGEEGCFPLVSILDLDVVVAPVVLDTGDTAGDFVTHHTCHLQYHTLD
jgi:hypothetical protein